MDLHQNQTWTFLQLQHHRSHLVFGILKLRYNIWYLIWAFRWILVHGFDVGLLMRVCYPKRSSCPYANSPPLGMYHLLVDHTSLRRHLSPRSIFVDFGRLWSIRPFKSIFKIFCQRKINRGSSALSLLVFGILKLRFNILNFIQAFQRILLHDKNCMKKKYKKWRLNYNPNWNIWHVERCNIHKIKYMLKNKNICFKKIQFVFTYFMKIVTFRSYLLSKYRNTACWTHVVDKSNERQWYNSDEKHP